ncbi:hypothetical protein BSIN_5315 [Burkholderia singularis]|uniref:Uncharacterized protein n=1 Tax=Burkholderia singularis TaxID=1503053 RepID=A0A238HDA3_9BURK|nr:hypothetical protein BSIN_5315 [Burkholderia singularis]
MCGGMYTRRRVSRRRVHEYQADACRVLAAAAISSRPCTSGRTADGRIRRPATMRVAY